ncbi:CapA family protein [Halogranum rubrum]|uniref:Poly-gamma-glutamate synthesis protein (Capsule biosynthesis protein) n=1 Tax=Halogranum salarium B-1 TaxID=1210908 RepID=J3JF05_9EURY|nr:CapA family protein [Halogranum salarium]EJN58801.1 poly-gamma-glutamate synthesis protein (capsule biosynthesis protein) [Halogranum salarium B-1]
MRRTRRELLAAGVAGLAGCLGAPTQTSPDCPVGGSGDARIGFVGDVMLGRNVNDRWVGENSSGVWGSTLGRLRALDGLVLNLECCVSSRGERWPNKTYYFRADPAFAVPALQAAGTSVVSLANNHVLDYREPALRDTRTHLSEAGIEHAGAGPNRDAALEPAVTDIGELTVATIALTDQAPAYAATETRPGTAYVSLRRSNPVTRALVLDALERANSHSPDLVIASLHWGPNWETSPADAQVAFAHWLVDHGVDVVHGHSAHVLQGVEVYRGRPILYDAADFVDDYIHKEGFHNKRSALFELVVTDGHLDTLRIVPIQIADEAASVADGEAATWVRETIRDRSNPFGTTVEHRGDGLSIPLGTC